MGFGYNTAWLAVPGRSVEDVADGLGLTGRSTQAWPAGTEAAYRLGMYVAAPVPGWTLAHGWPPAGVEASEPGCLPWLKRLSARLGEVQFFVTHRVTEYHGWALARAGRVVRAYCYVGESGEVPLFRGDPTPIERELGVGTRRLPRRTDDWDPADWDAWTATTPDEAAVLAVAGAWGVDPTTIVDDDVTGPGVHGLPSRPGMGGWVRRRFDLGDPRPRSR